MIEGKTSGREWPSSDRARRDFDSGLMAKDKSEKKKKLVTEDIPPAVEEDVEMTETKVSNSHNSRRTPSNVRRR